MSRFQVLLLIIAVANAAAATVYFLRVIVAGRRAKALARATGRPDPPGDGTPPPP